MKNQHRKISAAALVVASILSVASLQAATFVISFNSTTAQTLGSGSGQTGTVNSGVSLTVASLLRATMPASPRPSPTTPPGCSKPQQRMPCVQT